MVTSLASPVMRSTLYVPGDQPEKLMKAVRRSADGVIFDLEDAVAPGNKHTARELVTEFIRSQPATGPALLVRINWGDLGIEDLRTLIPGCGSKISAVYVPKVSTVDELVRVDAELNALEQGSGLERGSIIVVALLETARGILDARHIAEAPRVRRLAIGEADLSADLGIELTAGDEREMLTARAAVVLASAAAGIEPPVGPVSTDFRDLDALRHSTERLRRMGFRGRSCIHPAQVDIVNEVFTPTGEEVERAERLVQLYDRAVAAGQGVIADDGGKMIDEAVVRTARRVVAQHDHLNASSREAQRPAGTR